MTTVKQSYSEIKRLRVVGTIERAFVVEGNDDVAAYDNLFGKKFSDNWKKKWALVEAGGKKEVIEIVKLAKEDNSNWLGLVDRDEWSEEFIRQTKDQNPNVLILPRFCMESYLIDPDELWSALTKTMKQKIPGGVDFIREQIRSDLDKWLRHGVLWHVVNPLWEELRSLGFKEALLDLETAQDNKRIKAKLREWDRFLQADTIFKKFQQKLAEVRSLSEKEKLHHWIHGKLFWENVVHPLLNKKLGQKSAEVYRRNLWQNLPLPKDWQPIWEKFHDLSQ